MTSAYCYLHQAVNCPRTNENKHRYSEQCSGSQQERGCGEGKEGSIRMVTDGTEPRKGEHPVVYTQVKNIVAHVTFI